MFKRGIVRHRQKYVHPSYLDDLIYSEEIEKEKTRQRSCRNGFVRECCQQTIDQLTAEKRAIEEELVG